MYNLFPAIAFLSLYNVQGFTHLSIRQPARPSTINSNYGSCLLFSSASGEQQDTTQLDEIILAKFRKYCTTDKAYTNIISFTLEEFKPLGCTAEESINVASDGSTHVFLSKIVDGGNAQNAGLQQGDVIVGVSGSFDEVSEVVGKSLEGVKGLIGGRNEGDGLVLKIIRGSDVMSKHETALIDLCVLPDNDKDINNCIEALYKADYDMKEDTSGEVVEECNDGDMDCMLDAMFDVWNDELEPKKDEEDEKKEEETKKKPAPWSSRSSPSGTFVRDPKTGKMVNIDE